jgi:hypothetical protein
VQEDYLFRLAEDFLVDLRLAVDFFAVDFFADLRLAVDFFADLRLAEDFFFGAIVHLLSSCLALMTPSA